MKLKRFITDYEEKELKRIIMNENLKSDKAYSKIFREDLNDNDKKDFDFINNLLKDVIVAFSKFKAVSYDRFRFEYNWNYETDDIHFNGVGYININTLKNGF